MRTTKARLLALLTALSLALSLCVLPASAEGEDDIYALLYSDGELVLQKGSAVESGRTLLDGTEAWNLTTLGVLENGIDEYDDTTAWRGKTDNITKVTIKDSLTPTSTKGMFAWLNHVTEVNGLGNLNTSNVTNMSNMFRVCTALTTLDLSNFNTANVTNMQSMFNGCEALTTLDLSSFNTSNVTDMGYMFNGCEALITLDLSSFNTSNVTDMGYMFYGCKALITLDLSGFDTSKTMHMYEMFSMCTALTTLDLSNFKTSNLLDMMGMFRGCSALTTLDLSNFDTLGVGLMYDMFRGCSTLTTLDLSSFDTSTVTDLSGMFNGCEALTTLDLGSFNTSNVKNMAGMFIACKNLKTIKVSDRFVTSSLAGEGSGMFHDCTALVGGAGTEYDANHTDATYARIDGGTAAPGYFTAADTVLVTPTNLLWNVTYPNAGESAPETHYGMTSMYNGNTAPSDNYEICLSLYRVGTSEPVRTTNNGVTTGQRYFFTDNLTVDGLESGTYYFTAQSISRTTAYQNSEIATSGEWTYTRPNEALSAPTGAHWDGTTTAYTPVSDTRADGYRVEIQYSATNEADSFKIEGTSWGGEIMVDLRDRTDRKAGWYRFRVQTLSGDITQTRHSDFSEPSEAVYYGSGATDPGTAGAALVAPTNLLWNVKYPSTSDPASVTHYGMTSLYNGNTAPSDSYMIRLSLYRVGTSEPVRTTNNGVTTGQPYFSTDNLTLDGLESGTYYFTAQTVSTTTTEVSEVAASGEWTYTRPNEALSAPTGLHWDGTKTAYTPVSDTRAGGYRIETQYSATNEPDSFRWVSTQWGDGEYLPTFDLSDRTDRDAGWYRFRVQTLSSDITQTRHSDFSAPSEAVYYQDGAITAVSLPTAVRFVYYAETVPGMTANDVYSVSADTLPGWLSINNDTGELTGMPTDVGTNQLSFSMKDTAGNLLRSFSATLTVADNSDSNVEGEEKKSTAAQYVIEREIPDMTERNAAADRQFIIDDFNKGENFDKFRSFYLDGKELRGGKIGPGFDYRTRADIPADWQYYAEQGSTVITVLAQTFDGLAPGRHTIAATFAETNPATDKEETRVVAQNFNVAPQNVTPAAPARPSISSSDSGDSGDSDSSPAAPARPTTLAVTPAGELSFTVSGNTATVGALTPAQRSALTASGGAALTLDLTAQGGTVTRAVLSAELLNQLAEALANGGASRVETVLSSGKVTLDAATLAAILALGGDVQLTLEELSADALSEAQAAALARRESVKLLNIEIAAGGKEVTDFGGGRVEIAVPFTPAAGHAPRGYAVWHLAESGALNRHSTGYADNALSFRSAHFSVFAVLYDEPALLSDVPDGAWFTRDVDQVRALGLMSHVGDGLFAPNESLTRAMFVQILFNAEKGESGAAARFNDVPADAWYAGAVNWAAEAGIVSGVGDGQFSPNTEITREQLVTMLYNYAKYKNADLSRTASLDRFSDADGVSAWASPAAQWAVGNKLIDGMDGLFSANAGATRAQVAKLLAYYFEAF